MKQLHHAVSSYPGDPGQGQSSGLEIEFAGLSDPGRVRGNNEDYLGHVLPETATGVRTHGFLFALADGVGGHDRGEVASRLAIETMIAGFQGAAGSEAHSSLLQRLVQAANIQVYEAGRRASPGGVPMATTIVACALRFDRAAIAHVGDSRCYLVRHTEARPLTRDHTVVAEQVRLGLVSREEAAQSANRHLLRRSLGLDLFVHVDISQHQIVPGDVLLLCSDGLYGAISGEDMVRVLRQEQDLKAAATDLVRLANQRDGGDNISVQLIRVRSVERVGMYRGRPYKLY